MSRRTINRISVMLLLIGFGSAFIIYLSADAAFSEPRLDDPMATKKYLREMQMIGGQANVVASEFQNWFVAQWRGKTLARTVAILTVGVIAAFRLVATHPDFDPADPAENNIPPPGSTEE